MSIRITGSLAVIALLVLGGSAVRAVTPGQESAPLVKTAPAHILVNAQGMTLYLYTPDRPNRSVCAGVCAKYWPPMVVPLGTTIAPTMAGVSGVFGVAKRRDGAQQLTYDGAPLYTFIADKKPGDMNGQGAQGGAWWVVVVPPTGRAATAVSSPTATVVAASSPTVLAATTPTATPSSGGGHGGRGGY